jgi:hypothetical protein
MASVKFELSCSEGHHRGARCLKEFDASEKIRVRETSSIELTDVPAGELSIYRHTIYLEGSQFKIVQIFR